MPAKISAAIRQRAARIKLFLCDVDGVLTDGSIFIGGEREFKRFNIRDGLGLVLARRAGLKVGWVSARPSAATQMRAKELKIDFLVQQGDKFEQDRCGGRIAGAGKAGLERGLFCRRRHRGFGAAEARGLWRGGGGRRAEAKAAADFVTHAAGGHGAVREADGNDFAGAGQMGAVHAYYRE